METLRRVFTGRKAAAAGGSVDEIPGTEEELLDLFFRVILENQVKTLQTLIETTHFNVDTVFGKANRSLLHVAASVGATDCLQLLIKFKANPNIQDRSGNTALHLAARNGYKPQLRLLLEAGADIHAVSSVGLTALHWLAANGRTEMLCYLLELGADVDVQDTQGQTALHVACQNGHKNTVLKLIDRSPPADINKKDFNGRTPLFFTCRYGQSECARILMERGAVVCADNQGETPLRLCVNGGFSECAMLFIEYNPTAAIREIVYFVPNLEIEEEKFIGIFSRLRKERPDLRQTVAVQLEGALVQAGQQLLSVKEEVNANDEKSVQVFLRLNRLYSATADPVFVIKLGGAEVLFSTLEEWLNFVTNESIKKSNALETVVPVPFLDRLAAVINAFYHYCHFYDATVREGGRFFAFMDRHHDLLRAIVRLDAKLIFRHFHFLLECPSLLNRFHDVIRAQPFTDRRKWFYEYLQSRPERVVIDQLWTEEDILVVDRAHLIEDSCYAMAHQDVNRMLASSFSVKFKGEAGIGAGVRREWFDTLGKEILNPDYGLFAFSADGATVQPNPNSHLLNPDHFHYFRFAGRIIGLALFHQNLLDVHFTRSLYKHACGITLDYRDVASIDPEYYRSLQWILDNDITDLGLGINFSVELDKVGRTEMVELKPNGANIPVTEENKREYVQLATELKMTSAIGPQLLNLLMGFHEVIPPSLVTMFNDFELELMISGLPEIDVDDWQRNTVYSSGYEESSPNIQWFWEITRSLSQEDRASLLQFATGCSRVPHNGFSELPSAGGVCRFTISKIPDAGNDRLPSASTCFNLLKLPVYNSKEMLKERLLVAISGPS